MQEPSNSNQGTLKKISRKSREESPSNTSIQRKKIEEMRVYLSSNNQELNLPLQGQQWRFFLGLSCRKKQRERRGTGVRWRKRENRVVLKKIQNPPPSSPLHRHAWSNDHDATQKMAQRAQKGLK